MLSLLLLSLISVLDQTPLRPWPLAAPIVYAALFAAFMLSFAAFALAPLWRAGAQCGKWAFRRLGRAKPRGAALGVWALAAVGLLSVWCAEVTGTSFLFAAYLSGIAFAGVSGVREEWEAVVGPVVPPLLGLFFAATTGFEIPFGALFKRGALALGAVLGCCAVAGKMLAVLAVEDVSRDGLAVAVAMLGRGEFGFLIAIESLRTGLLDEDTYATVVWGVLIPTVLTPIIFVPTFRYRKRKMEMQEVDRESEVEAGTNIDTVVADGNAAVASDAGDD